jgi:catechol 2,3-dioxygenase-like lactoylglutathione lyase family enzyme
METMFHVKGIDHVVIRVLDLERMVGFYREVLGCTVERRRDDLGLVHMRAGGNLIDLVSVVGEPGRAGGAPPARDGRNMDHLCLRIEPFDIERLRTHLKSYGIEAGEVKINYGAEGDGPSVYLNDPQGNLIELKGPPSGAESSRV